MSKINGCCIVSGFNDEPTKPTRIHYSEVYRSKYIQDFWYNEVKYKNYESLNSIVDFLISGIHKDISVRLALAENLIKLNKL